ncbi:Ionotropic glutamate receptor L-glutamate and glycine-binding domain [Trinorchestia longiramus]|nr:Ionotropic glutamate receptor L-glutamate and glycine-binding domain [Trinorchestia longiramus]
MYIGYINILFVFVFCSFRILALPDLIKIGGIFDPYDQRQELAFRYAVERVNQDRSILVRSALHAQIERLPADDSFHASKRVCQLLRSGVAAIFGPQSEKTANHVQSICDALEIPHIETRWDYKLRRDEYSLNLYPHPTSLSQAYYDVLKRLEWKSFVVLYDSSEGLVRLQSLLKSDEWTVTVRQLQEDADWRPLLKDIKKSQDTKFVIDVRQDRILELLKQAAQIGLMREYHSYFITSLDLHLVDMEDFKYGGTNITSLRLVDPNKPEAFKFVEDWKYGELRYGKTIGDDITQITTESALMYDAVHLFARALDDLDRSREVDITPLYCEGVKTWPHGSSLINFMKWYSSHRSEQDPTGGMSGPYDSRNPGAMTMMPNMPYGMPPNGRPGLGVIPPIGSPMDNRYGSMMMPLGMPYTNMSHRPFDMVQVYGLTGLIKFDTRGFRTDFELDILELDSKVGLKKVGVWTMDGGANYTRYLVEASSGVALNLQNRTLVVTTALAAPYTMLKEASESLTGNDRFEGFCVDLIHEISRDLGFNYSFQLVDDGKYGNKDQETGEWNGMVRDLLDHKADLGIVDFTITYEREEAVDFSMPFMNLGISIIYKKPTKKAPSLFSFMSPFSLDVWIYMATAYLGVSVLLFMLARMSPKEWDCPYPCIQDPDELENCFTLSNSMWFNIATFLCQGADIAPRIAPEEWDNPHPCIQDPDELENAITLSNAFWFTIGSLMQQGSDIAPKAVSTRIVAGIWWFFTLIMISSYTANLAAFLTVERMESPIEGAEDLAKQTKIKYGSKLGGSTYSFFRDSKLPTYKRMWTAMSTARPTVFTSSNQEGVERVSKADGMYAFMMESSSIDYVVERRCDLMQVGGLLDSKSYGIALPPGSPYTNAISSAILKLKETGVLHTLKTRWWKERKGGGRCKMEDSSVSTSGAAELGLDNVGGVFVVLIGGMVMAAFMAVCEFLWNARELATDENASFCDELSSEVRFIMKCSGNTKAVRKKGSVTPEEAFINYGSYGSSYGYMSRK